MRRLIFMVGFIFGYLFAELLSRKQFQRLAFLEAKQAREKARFAQYEREWQEEMAKMPFEERLDYELWEAQMRLDDWNPDDEDDYPDDEDDEEEDD